MKRLLIAAFFFVLLCGILLYKCPTTAFAGAEPGVSRAGAAPLDDCQKRFTEAVRFVEREQDYASEKARYRQAAAKRCSEERWYDLGIMECVLFVPVFGLILPFFGVMIISTVRSVRESSMAGSAPE